MTESNRARGASGNSIFGPENDHLRCAVIEPDRFGGTCTNRGCVPSKLFVVAADTADTPHRLARLGVDLLHRRRLAGDPRPRARPHRPVARIRGQVLRVGGIDVSTDPARFVSPRVRQLGDEQPTAKDIVVVWPSGPVPLVRPERR